MICKFKDVPYYKTFRYEGDLFLKVGCNMAVEIKAAALHKSWSFGPKEEVDMREEHSAICPRHLLTRPSGRWMKGVEQ